MSELVLESDLQKKLLGILEEEPATTVQVALAKARVSKTQLSRWKKRDPDFLVRWNAIARARNEPVRMSAPRQASAAVVRRILYALEEDPTLTLQEHCRVEGTTVARVEAACAADPRLADLYERYRDAVVAPVATTHLKHMQLARNAPQREKFLMRNGGELWGGGAEQAPRGGDVHVHGDVNLAVLASAPKATRLDDGRFQPRDIPLKRLVAGDSLPSMAAARTKEKADVLEAG